MQTQHTPDDFGRLLVDFFSGNSDVTHLLDLVEEQVKHTINYHYSEASYDDREEIQSEVVARLCEIWHSKSIPVFIKGREFLYGLIKDAIKKVRSEFRPAGQRSRLKKGERYPSPTRFSDIPEKSLIGADVESEIGIALDVSFVLSYAEPQLTEALNLICYNGSSLAVAADAVGYSRSTLRREIQKFSLRFRTNSQTFTQGVKPC